MTIEPVRGRQAEPVIASNCSAAVSRKDSKALRRSAFAKKIGLGQGTTRQSGRRNGSRK